jgi:hypothetical protein
MPSRRLTIWDLAYVILLVVAILVLLNNLFTGRYGMVALTICFLVLGVGMLAYSWRRGEPLGPEFLSIARPARERRPLRSGPEAERSASGRLTNWLPESITAGFAATGVLTAGLLFAYAIANLLGSDTSGASTMRQWFWALTHNPATETARENLPLALVLNFVAGIVWSVIYAGVIEPRLGGPGWRRGMLFSLIPWFLSLALFLPIIGGGFFGASLGAGPLPIVGNLLLHLLYGLTLGEVYASQRVLAEDGESIPEAERQALLHTEQTIAIGVVPGLVLGGLIGLIGSSVFAPSQDPWLVAVFGAIAGSVIGVLIGSFIGLTPVPEKR